MSDNKVIIPKRKLRRIANKLTKRKAHAELLRSKKEQLADTNNMDTQNTEHRDDKTVEEHKSKKRKIEKEEGEITDDDILEPALETTDPEKLKEISAKIRQELRQLKAENDDDAPVLSLTEDGLEAKFDFYSGSQDAFAKPLFLRDVQDLVLFSTLGGVAMSKPRWCTILRLFNVGSVVVFIAEGVSIDHVKKFPESFANCKRTFSRTVEVYAPACYNSNLKTELLLLRHTEATKNKSKYRFRSIHGCDPASIPMDKLFPIKSQEDSGLVPVVADSSNDTFPRTHLLLNLFQLVDNNFPLPSSSGDCTGRLSKETYLPVTDSSPMFSVDCEMVLCEGNVQELARISVVNEKLECVYDSFVKPMNKIIDYCTQFSGITPEILDGKTSSLDEVKLELRKILPPNGILVGHSLDCDLKVIQICHPYCVDTTTIFNLYGCGFRKNKLRVLVKELLGQDIQNDSSGHDSTEDATATMKLVQLKLKKGLVFGNTTLGWSLYNYNSKEPQEPSVDTPDAAIKPQQASVPHYDGKHGEFNTIFHHAVQWKKKVSLVGLEKDLSQCKTLAPQIVDMDDVSVVTAKSNDEMTSIVNGILHMDKTRLILKFHDMKHLEQSGNHKKLIQKQLRKLDKRIAKVFSAMQRDSLLIVLFGGSTRPLERNVIHSGLCMVEIKT